MVKNVRIKQGGTGPAIGNERGAALIIVLGMLLLLTILGTSMLATSTSELKIAGNYRNSEEAFYTSDAALEFASTWEDIFVKITPSVETWPASGQGRDLGIDFQDHGPNENNHMNPDFADYNRITFTGANDNENKADVKVEFLDDDESGMGSGTAHDSVNAGGGGFGTNKYAVSVIAYGPNGNVVKLQAQVGRAVSK